MALKVGELFALLTLDNSNFNAGIKGAKGAIQGLAEDLGKTGAIMTNIFTEPLMGVGESIIDTGKTFSTSMSKVQALSGATTRDMERLTDAAQYMGATTKFTASESADALSYMALAGWNTEQMLSGLPGIVNLAAASGEDLATVSDIVTDALTAFGLKAEDSVHFADLLAITSAKSNTDVYGLGEAFKYVASTAGAMGYTAEDTAIALGLMANAGIKGSQAGTSLRAGLTRLVKPTKEVQEMMDKYGITLTDSEGNMLPMIDIMRQMRTNMGDLSEAELAAAAATLFGQEGMAGWLAIITASPEAFEELTGQIYNCDGAAEDMATTMLDNLGGDMTLLSSAVDGLKMSFFNLVEDGMRAVVKAATGLVTWFNGLGDGVKKLVLGVGTFLAIAGPILTFAGLFLKYFRGVGTAVGLVLNPFTLLGGVMAYVFSKTETGMKIFRKLRAFVVRLGEGLAEAKSPFESFAKAVQYAFGYDAAMSIRNFVNDIKSGLDDAFKWFGKFTDNIAKGFEYGLNATDGGGILKGLEYAFRSAKNQLQPILRDLGTKAITWLTDTFKASRFGKFVGKIVSAFKAGMGMRSGGIWTALKFAFTSAFMQLHTLISPYGKKVLEWLSEKMGSAGEAVSGFVSNVGDFFKSVFTPANIAIAMARVSYVGGNIMSAIGEKIKNAKDAASSFITSIGEFFKGVFTAENVSKAMHSIAEIGAPIIEFIGQSIVNSVSGRLAFAGYIVELIKNALSPESMASGFDALGTLGGVIVDAIGAGITSVVDGASVLASGLSDLIKSIDVSALVDGAANLALNLISALGDEIVNADWVTLGENLCTLLGNAAQGLAAAAAAIAANIVGALLDMRTYKAIGQAFYALLSFAWGWVKARMVSIFDVGWIKDIIDNFMGTIDNALKSWEFDPSEANYFDELEDGSYELHMTTGLDDDDFDRLKRLHDWIADGTFDKEAALNFVAVQSQSELETNIANEMIREMFGEDPIPVDAKVDPTLTLAEEADLSTERDSIIDELMQNSGEGEGQPLTVPVDTVELDTSAIAAFNGAGVTGAKEVVSGITTELNSDATKAAVGAAAQHVTDNISTLGFYDQGKSIGANLSAGMAAGITAGKAVVVAAATAVAFAAAAAMRKALDIHSPSGVTEDIGLFTDGGLAKGMLGGIRGVSRAAVSVSDAVVDGLNIPNPASGLRGIYGANTQRRDQLYIDYDRLADAMSARPQVFEVDGREFARGTQNDTARQQDIRARRIAFGYGH